jgi:hypothetical protein
VVIEVVAVDEATRECERAELPITLKDFQDVEANAP